MSEFKREVQVRPSRNWVREESSKNYGITTCWIYFILIGDKGAVQFALGTQWASKPVRDHLKKFDIEKPFFVGENFNNPRIPMGVDVGYHSKVPQYEDQRSMECSLLPEGRCYYDGSGARADKWMEGFLAGGTKWLWRKLEEYYKCMFEEADYPDVTPEYLPHPDEKPDEK